MLIEVKNLKKYFYSGNSIIKSRNNIIKAVDGVSFHMNKGETFGLVGESGCGKSTLGRCVNRLYDLTEGEIFYEGVDIANLNKQEMKPYNKKMQIIFQDPYSSLNPYLTVGKILDEPIKINQNLSRKDREDKAKFLLEKVGLKQEDLYSYPHEFSGGQRQRIGIARALMIDPEFILCDEPISALDVSIQAQVVNMLEDLQDEYGLTYLFVAHDLSMVKYISDRIGVMYLGKIVEIANSEELYANPLHPYTKALLSAIPIPDPIIARNLKPDELTGEIPSALNVPSGCRFRTRCPNCMDICKTEEPNQIEVSENHFVSCHLYNK